MAQSLKTRTPLRTRRAAATSQQHCLQLTVVFHPDHERIGAQLDIARWRPGESLRVPKLTLGRAAPTFSDGAGIDEAHVARAALDIVVLCEPGLPGAPSHLSCRLSALPGAAVQLGQDEDADLLADARMLRQGIPIRLGHGVVLLLRLTQPVEDHLSPCAQQKVSGCLIGVSSETRRLKNELFAASRTGLPVLLLGESGSGKEIAALALHQLSSRSARPFIAVNMTAITESLAASELFGCQRGAFTGAEARPGFFRMADGGSLFLDEIGDTLPVIQPQLLRALELGEIQVVGGRQQQVDIRVIAATDASTRPEDGFKHALLTRLSGHTLRIAPLRERLEDIGVQGKYFLLQGDVPDGPVPFRATSSEPNVAAHWGRCFFDALRRDWPGNSREFRQFMTKAATADPDCAPLLERTADTPGSDPEAIPDVIDDSLGLARVYDQCDFEVKATAARLGVTRQKMYRTIQANPHCRLVGDISDDELAAAKAAGDDLYVTARRLGVSAHALRPRFKKIRGN